MGEVWSGDHVGLKLKVAMKVLKREAHANHEIASRFAREAFLLGQMQTDHVVRVYDFVASGRYSPVLVMEFINGPPLGDVLAAKQFTVEQAIDLGVDLARALRELHTAKVVHRDIKPANVMLRPRLDGGYRPVFIDLGVSRLLEDDAVEEDDQLTEITAADRCVGTLEYMAPEQILSSRSATPAADLYAVGAMLFRAVSGCNVFGDLRGVDLARRKLTEAPPRIRTLRNDAAAHGFAEVLERLLAQSPGDRFASADELLAQLEALRPAGDGSLRPSMPSQCAGSIPPAAREPVAAVAPRGKRRLSVFATVAAVAALGVATVAGAYAARHARLGSGAAGVLPDAEPCRVVGQRVEGAPLLGARSFLLSIACPESGLDSAATNQRR
jgi:serine/threonine-protein kinase